MPPASDAPGLRLASMPHEMCGSVECETPQSLAASAAQFAQRRLRHLFGGDAEVLVELLVGTAGAEAGHADEGAVGADDGVPTLADAGFHRDIDPRLADEARALG